VAQPADLEIRDDADYVRQTWRRSDESGRTIRGVAFSDCRFDGCRFGETVFEDCSFTGCTFRSCDLAMAGFPGSRFIDVAFRESKLVGIDWTVVEVMAKAGLSVAFEACRLDEAAFSGMNLRGVHLV